MPTRNRPELLERALGSALEATAAVAGQVEVTVSDGSDDDASGQVVRRLLADWPGGYRYVHNRPALSLPGNINRAMGPQPANGFCSSTTTTTCCRARAR